MLDLHGYGPSIFYGALLTLKLAFLSLLIALILGLLTAKAKLSSHRRWRVIGQLYTTVIRGVPDLVLMLLIFFGIQIAVNMLGDWIVEHYQIGFYINIDEFTAGVLTIGLIFGAYMGETFRGAFLAVERGQIDAARAFGMSSVQVFRRVLFPQMMRHALPGLGNNWQVLVKTTALASVIGLTDMVKLAKEAAGAVHEPFIFFIPVAIIYLALTTLSEWGISALERHYSIGVVRE
ncbi:MAG: ABC transporter permease [Plesiomonas sp.]|uniref:ABC transporter permease n=1 Tax=Plesiomonas sp. TaxID=2486279 RepID=UPI003F3AF6EC